MLRELTNLAIEADGRYATDAELKFVRKYLASVENRITTYRELRELQDKIIDRVQNEKKKDNGNGSKDPGSDGTEGLSDVCIRDMRAILRYSAAAMLVNDLEHLRDILLWYKTIVRSFAYNDFMDENYRLLEDIVNIYLPPEKAGLMTPVLQLDQTLLA
jgi:hypothetical protein